MPEKAEAKKMNVNIQADISDHAKSHKAPLTGKYRPDYCLESDRLLHPSKKSPD
jgi:hypothetical protein